MKSLISAWISPAEFQAIKAQIIDATSLSRDALHAHIGLIVMLTLYIVLGWRFWSALIAWMFVVTLAVMGETLDYTGDGDFIAMWSAADHFEDLMSTIFWPTLFFLSRLYSAIKNRWQKMPSANQSVDQTAE